MKMFIVVCCLALALPAFAQELNCDVTVNMDNIPAAARDNLRTFKSDVERYLNNVRWTDEDLGGEKIDCSISIFFLTASTNNSYTAQAVVVSQRPVYKGIDKSGKHSQIVRISDEKWEFLYVPGQQMAKDDFRFDPLTSFLNFYAYLIIGLDLETYTEMSGSRYFQKAHNIATQASSSAFGKDWQGTSGNYTKFGFVDELMNLKYQPFRFAFFQYHFDGLDLLATEQQKGLENILKAVESIAELRQRQNPRSFLAWAFFNAKHLEISDAFLTWPDRSVYDRLIAADQANQKTYEDYRSRR